MNYSTMSSKFPNINNVEYQSSLNTIENKLINVKYTPIRDIQVGVCDIFGVISDYLLPKPTKGSGFKKYIIYSLNIIISITNNN